MRTNEARFPCYTGITRMAAVNPLCRHHMLGYRNKQPFIQVHTFRIRHSAFVARAFILVWKVGAGFRQRVDIGLKGVEKDVAHSRSLFLAFLGGSARSLQLLFNVCFLASLYMMVVCIRLFFAFTCQQKSGRLLAFRTAKREDGR